MRAAFALGVVLIVVGAGCSQSEANVVGEWRIDNGLDRTASTSSIIAQQYKLNFKADKTYTMGDFKEGTYAVDGHTVTLTVTKLNGLAVPKRTDPLNKSIDFKLSDDGKSLITIRERNPMKFVRVTGPGP